MKTHKNPNYFYNPQDFPELLILQNNWKTIKEELEKVDTLMNHKKWMETFPNYVKSDKDESWQVFTFRFFGMNHWDHQRLCPKTTELINQTIEIISCDFSKMKGKTRILPHTGYTKMVLRCHLPLKVPEDKKCGIQVGDEIHFHEEGKLLVFDDSFMHEAWNESEKDRTVLMFDIPNPRWGYTANEISRYKIENMDDPFLLNLAPKEAWVKAFEKGELPV